MDIEEQRQFMTRLGEAVQAIPNDTSIVPEIVVEMDRHLGGKLTEHGVIADLKTLLSLASDYIVLRAIEHHNDTMKRAAEWQQGLRQKHLAERGPALRRVRHLFGYERVRDAAVEAFGSDLIDDMTQDRELSLLNLHSFHQVLEHSEVRKAADEVLGGAAVEAIMRDLSIAFRAGMRGEDGEG